jgi:hypothetical protein
MNDVRPPVWILVLVFILTIWNPASLALRAASAVSSLSSPSTLSLAFLVVRIAVTSIGVAAGIALWLRRPGAVWLAKLALVLVAVETAVRMASRTGLSGAPPGTRLPLALAVILHSSAWYLYLQLSRRVRAAYGLESLADQGEPHA